MPPKDESLLQSLQQLPLATQEILRKHRFSPDGLVAQAEFSRTGGQSNVVEGELSALSPSDLAQIPEINSPEWSRLRERGEEALSEGRCALSVLAGGMATRMGGVIKALVPASQGRTFLELRLAEQAHLKARYGKAPPLWLMTSHSTHQGIEDFLGDRLNEPTLALFRQGLSVRLNPDRTLFLTKSGEPSLYAPGHGDYPDCIRQSGLLEPFVAEGGQYVMATNLDNLGGGLDPVLVGMHLESECAVTCEVVDKVGADRGGIPARLNGRPVILEEFRLPSDFDPTGVSVFNVNTFAFAAPLLSKLEMQWTYFEVTKQVEERPAIQFERLINEVTFHLDTQYLRVPREGVQSRFLPVKDQAELNARQPDIDALAAARGMITAP